MTRSYHHRHVHVHANINQYMAADKIRADVRRVFALNPDTIVINEAIACTRDEIREQAAKHGYGVRVGKGALSQLVECWREDTYIAGKGGSSRSTLGRAKVTPDRGRIRQTLHRKGGAFLLVLLGSHLISKAWTSNDKLTAWRRAQWWVQYRGLVRAVKRQGKRGVCVWSADQNRPKGSWPGKPMPALTSKLRKAGWRTARIAHTNGTHGKAIYDYVGVASKRYDVAIVDWSTPALASDHDAVVVDLEVTA